ncbi:MAG: hypothetical protein WCK92_12320 [Bacteroidota bacterium]
MPVRSEKLKRNNYGFKTSLNTAVFTTKFVLNENKVITKVSHYKEDGAWEFFSDDEFIEFEKVAKLVSLEEILDLDPSIKDLFNLKEGYQAIRMSLKDKWIINKI